MADEVEVCEVFTRWRRGGLGARVPPGWAEILARDPALRSVALVVELVLGGRSVRLSTRHVASRSGLTGLRHDARAALIEQPALSASYELGVGASPARRLDFSFDAGALSPVEILDAGGMLGGVAEVSLEPADRESDYDRRLVILRGDVVSVSFGAPAGRRGREIVTVSVQDPRDSVNTLIPPWAIDDERFTGLPDEAQGASFPVILNNGYRTPAVRLTDASTGPNNFAVAAGVVDVTAASGNVFVNGLSVFGGVDAWVAESAVDSRGLIYTRIRFTNAGRAWDDADAVHVTSSALDELERERPVEVIRRVCETLSPLGKQGINPVLFASASARYPAGLGAPRVLINASGSSSATVLDWIESGFLRSFPMLSMVWSRGGYGPILTDSRSEPIASLVAGAHPLFERVSEVTETPKRALVNRVQIRYGYDPMRDTYAGVVRRTPASSAICAASRELVGARDAEPLDSPYIADRQTADYVADWIVQHNALPSYIVEYEASPYVFAVFERGETVLLSDDDFGWEQRRATIEAITYEREKCAITLRVWLRYLDVGPGASSRPSPG